MGVGPLLNPMHPRLVCLALLVMLGEHGIRWAVVGHVTLGGATVLWCAVT